MSWRTRIATARRRPTRWSGDSRTTPERRTPGNSANGTSSVHERSEAVDDIYIVYAIHMVGRERVEGHDTIAFTLTPRPDSKPKTREGDLMKHFSVKAWISESDKELVRLEADAIDNVSFGFGVLGAPAQGSAVCRSCAARSTVKCGFRPWSTTAAARAWACCSHCGVLARPSIPATVSSPSTHRRASNIRNNESRPADDSPLLA